MQYDALLKPATLRDGLKLKNRIVMAPLTRCMATADCNPTDAMAEYYARRAASGLIITESVMVSACAQGYPNTPGLYNPTQIKGWHKVTDKVHGAGGRIFAQLWHAGRISHPVFLDGNKPIAPSPIGIDGTVPRMRDLEYGSPRAMTATDMQNTIAHFRQAAANAAKAGFDGVELHGANGYLLDQFLHWSSNQRHDQWGGSPENMARFVLAVVDAVCNEISHVGIRLSPAAYSNMTHDSRDVDVFNYLLKALQQYQLSYVHTGIFQDDTIDYLGGTVTQYLKTHFDGPIMAGGGYTPKSANALIQAEGAELISFGRSFIANPDLVQKITGNEPLTKYDDAMLKELY